MRMALAANFRRRGAVFLGVRAAPTCILLCSSARRAVARRPGYLNGERSCEPAGRGASVRQWLFPAVLVLNTLGDGEGAPCAPLSFHSGEEHVSHGSGAAGLPIAPVHAGTEASFEIYSNQHPGGVRGPIYAENAAQAAAAAAAGLGFAQGTSHVI